MYTHVHTDIYIHTCIRYNINNIYSVSNMFENMKGWKYERHDLTNTTEIKFKKIYIWNEEQGLYLRIWRRKERGYCNKTKDHPLPF